MMGLQPPISASKPAIVTLSGASITHNGGGGGATAGIRFNADGTVDKREGGTYTQISSTTDWISPNGLATSDYEVRYTSASKAFDTEAAAEDTWIALGSNREWNLSASGDVDGLTCTFEIRIGGVTQDTGAYSFTADDS